MIMATFQKVKLGDICDVRDGTHDSPKESTFGFPLVTSKHIKNRRVDLSDTYLISENDFDQINKRSKVDRWDILFSMIGTVGEIAFVKNNEKYAIKTVGLIKTGNERLSKYLFYYLWSPQAKADLESLLSGSTQKFISLGKLREFPIFLPKELDQTRIASVLSAYDDLIENNEKRIKVLEEMAQLLYTEWFVKFKFPGHEKVKMIESSTEYGVVPEGWEIKKLQEIGMAITGKTPPTGNLDNFDGDVLFIKTPDIHGNIFILDTEQTLSETGSNLQLSKLLPKNTVFISCIGTLGVVGITSRPSQTNQQINSIILNDKTDYIFFYFFAKDLKQQLIGLGSNGATMGNVNKGKFEKIKILYPAEETRKAFFNATVDVFDEILSLQIRNKNLSKTRDLLIPQLVTGRRELK